MVLTQVLNVFLDILEKIPKNLTNASLALLGTFVVIDIATAIFKVDEIDWQKWLVQKVIRIGMLTWMIKNYSWILGEVLNGFIKIANIAVGNGSSLVSDLVTNPSKIVDYAIAQSSKFLELVGLSPKTWIYLIVIIFIVASMFFIAFQVIITMTEFYLLTGISIIFIPFGAIKMGENYYTNVLKTVVGCSIKVGILNLLLLISEKIIFNISLTQVTFESGVAMLSTLLILAYLITSVPSMATSLVTGSPALSANDALRTGAAAVGAAATAVTMMAKTAYTGASAAAGAASGAAQGMSKGADIGADMGGLAGKMGGNAGLAGRAVGGLAGGALGAVAGALGGGIKGGVEGGRTQGKGSKLMDGAMGGASKLAGKAVGGLEKGIDKAYGGGGGKSPG